MKTRHFLSLLLFMLISTVAWSQSIEFQGYMKQGDRAYAQGQYQKALGFYQSAAKVTNNGDPAAANKKINSCRAKIREQKKKDEANKNQEPATQETATAETPATETPLTENEVKNDVVSGDAVTTEQRPGNNSSTVLVSDIKFGTGGIMGMISPYGDPVYASDLNDDNRLKMKVFYTPVEEKDRVITVRMNITDPNGNLVTDPSDPYGAYTAVWPSRTLNQKGTLIADFVNNFAPGEYNCTLYFNNDTVYTTTLQINRKPGEASYLTVNGETSVYSSIDPEGGIQRFEVLTDAPSFDIIRTTTNIDQRSDISIEGNTIIVKTRPNYTFYTINTAITVTAGGRNVRINFTQEATNVLTAGDWLEQLNKVVATGSYHSRTITYKGEDWEMRQHYTIMHWDNVDMWYIGTASRRNEERLYGMYITGIPDRQSVFNFTSFFVGKFDKNQMSEGSCYDRLGNLIYKGQFKGNMPFPASAYPEQSNFYPSDGDLYRRFDYLIEENGHAYLGETYNGLKDGFGILFYGDGNCWVGTWKNDMSVEGAFLEYSGFGHKRNHAEDNR